MAVLVSKQIKVPSVGKRASDYAVGDSVFLPVNGTNTEFLVVHQGNPNSSIYSATFDNGTILLMKDIYENRQWHSSNINDYANSTIHTYLNGTFFGLLGTAAQNAVKQVKVPYRPNRGASKTCSVLENGLSTKLFLLSLLEVGLSETLAPIDEGSKLGYFESGTSSSANTKRIALFSGGASAWWMRSPYCFSSDTPNQFETYYIGSLGGSYVTTCSTSLGIRPALVIANTTLFDSNTNVIKG